MDFFERQEAAHRETGRLIVMFAVAVVMIVLSVNLVVYGLAQAAATVDRADDHTGFYPRRRNVVMMLIHGREFSPVPMFIGTTFITLGIIVCGSLYKIATLSRGGAAVAQLMGARPIFGAGPLPEEKVLQNVVEEMSIAAGVPVPQIWVMDQEQGINAFAAGFGTADAVVCVTRGCLDQLSRDELQGVVAHEFSHILNGDMRMNLRLAGILNGILVIGLTGYILMRSLQYVRTGGRKNDGGQIVIALLVLGGALFAIGYVGVFFGRLIQAAVSRQREYLADASAVQFTRHPMGLANALKKIGRFSSGSMLNSPHALEMGHLFFATGSRMSFTRLLATHPPLAQRIKLLDPTFNGDFYIGDGAAEILNESGNANRAGALASMLVGEAAHPRGPMPVSQVVNRAGQAPAHALAAATNLLASIPDPVQRAAREPFSARAMALTLLLSDDPAVRTIQAQKMRATIDAPTANEAMRLAPAIIPLDEATHIALMDLAQPALKQLSFPQLHDLALTAKSLIEADGRVTLFEYAMHRQLGRMLISSDHSQRPRPVEFYALSPLMHDVMTVLTALAHSGNDDKTAADALRAGVARLDLTDVPEEPQDRTLPALDRALDRLMDSCPAIKKKVIDAAAHVVSQDGVIQPEEAAMLRAICAAIDVPMPIV